MIDINIIRTNPELVKENIKKKFQFDKVELVDKVLVLDEKVRALKQEGDSLRAKRNTISNQIGSLMKEKKIEEANSIKAEVVKNNERVAEIEKEESEISSEIKNIMMKIPQIIDKSVPIGKDDSENVEIQK